MKKTKLRTILSFLFSFIAVLTACKNNISQTEEITENCKCTIYVQAPSKTASPVLPDNIWYTLVAAHEEDVGEAKKINPDYDENGTLKPARPDEYYPGTDKVQYSYILTSNFPGTNYFTMELPHNGTWYFYIEGYTSNETRNDSTRILVGSTSGSARGSHYSVSLTVDFIPSGSGTVRLPVDVSQTTINKLQITNAGDGVLNGTYYKGDDGIISINKDNIAAGAYEATLTFYKDDIMLFRILNETINVKENFTTDSWIYSANCEYLKEKTVTHTTEESAFPPDERLITKTADFVITPEYLYKKCNTVCYVSINGSNTNIGSKLKPFSTIDYAINRTVALNENFNFIQKAENFTIYIDGILLDGADENANYTAPETNVTVSILIKPTVNNAACEVRGNLIFGNNYELTIDSGATTDLAKQKFVFKNIETQSPISINNCTILGDITLKNVSGNSTIYNSVIGSSSIANGQVDITVNNSKLSFINPNTSATNRGSYTTLALKNLKINNGGSVEIFNNATTSQAQMNIYNTLDITNAKFKIWSTILKTKDTKITNCLAQDSVFFDSATEFTSTGTYTATNSNVKLDSTDHFEATNGLTVDGGKFDVYRSSIATGGAGTIELKNNCDVDINSTEDDLNMDSHTITGKIKLNNCTAEMSYYTFEAGSDLYLSDNANLTGEMLEFGTATNQTMNIISIIDSSVELLDTKLYFKDYLEINNSEFSLKNTTLRGRKAFIGSNANSFTIIGNPNSSQKKEVTFDNVTLNFLNIANVPAFLNSKNDTHKKIIFKDTEIKINNSAFTGDGFIDENTDITFKDTRIPNGNFLVDESSKIIFSGETNQVSTSNRIYLDKTAKFYVQNPISVENIEEKKIDSKESIYWTDSTLAKIVALNPIDNESAIVLLDDNKQPIDFPSSFAEGDARYTIENVGFNLSYGDYNSVRSGILIYDSTLSSLPSGWGARLRAYQTNESGYESVTTGPDSIIGATKGSGTNYNVPATSSYSLAAAKTTKIIGGLWSNSTRWSGNQFNNTNIPEINYTLFYGNEILYSQTSISTLTDPQAASNSEFILGDWDPEIESRLGSQDSITYTIRMTFKKINTNAGSYTCNIPLIVTKN